MSKRGKTPEIGQTLEKLAEGATKEMSKTKDYPRLSLSVEEMKTVRRMNAIEFDVFLLQKGILDFQKPVLLETPDGVAEEWMRSAEQIRAFIQRHEAN